MARTVTCPKCGGSGTEPGTIGQDCGRCGGTGEVDA